MFVILLFIAHLQIIYEVSLTSKSSLNPSLLTAAKKGSVGGRGRAAWQPPPIPAERAIR